MNATPAERVSPDVTAQLASSSMPSMRALEALRIVVKPFRSRNENWKSSQSWRKIAPLKRNRPPHVVFQPTS